MREGKPFRDEATEASDPDIRFHVGELNRKLGQPTLSVAQIDEHHFNTMHESLSFYSVRVMSVGLVSTNACAKRRWLVSLEVR